MKKMITKTLLASAVTVVCALSANVASAQTTVFPNFTVDPVNSTLANFTADKMTGNYVEIANFNTNGTFTANLVWTAAAFVANDGTTLDEHALLQFVRSKMADYKVPRHVTFLPVLPRNATGKVLKTALRQIVRPAGGGT